MFIVRFFLLCLLWHCANINAAETTITLAAAIDKTFSRNPELQLFAYQKQQISGLTESADQGPALELGLEIENVAGSGHFSGFDAAETTLALSSVIELGDKRELRTATLATRAQTLQLEQ